VRRVVPGAGEIALGAHKYESSANLSSPGTIRWPRRHRSTGWCATPSPC
jgi:hypothetical protein